MKKAWPRLDGAFFGGDMWCEEKSLVLMHKKTGKLFEMFRGWLGWVVAWEVLQKEDLVDAANAAASSSARKEMQLKFLKYGIKLLTEEK